PVVVAVNQSSGGAGISFWVNQYFELKGDQRIEKKDPAIQKLKEWVDREYAEGRNTVIGDEELISAMQQETPDLWQKLAGEHTLL
ncbi:MAG TPA: 2-isopropylmalate synthase, partial [Firmicutes bacterium]|nr:2-isopropylmalate synthase [Bacillota bacterium]